MELQQLNDLLPPALQQCSVSCRAYWKDVSGKYINSTGLFIGKILVATYSYNDIRSKDAVNEDYIVTSSVPGIKSTLGKYGTVEECQAKCIQVAQHFLVMLGHGS
jgi:hypothetical protein